ncbi:MAG TPA: hypothetical protein VFA97_08720 [Gaiellaceae bacterium]|nr:hypothetical protein [Gaiellaceae bacterium]
MRLLVSLALFLVALGSALPAEPSAIETATSAGVQVTIPAGWHADTNRAPACDPARLMLLSSGPIRTAHTGGLLPPTRDQVLVAVVEDHANLPVGNLHRPARFSVDWSHPLRLEGSGCGVPDAPASMHWFHTHGRYLGLTVFPGSDVAAATRAQTIAVMDSLRVTDP